MRVISDYIRLSHCDLHKNVTAFVWLVEISGTNYCKKKYG